MLDECLISILQYLIDNSNTSNADVILSHINIIDIILYYHPHNIVALNARQCLEEKLNNLLEEMNKEETMK